MKSLHRPLLLITATSQYDDANKSKNYTESSSGIYHYEI
jgi:hypothetical protein